MLLDEKKLSVMPAPVGRPPLGLKPTLVRLSPAALARIDELAGPNRRAEFIREAVENELQRRRRTPTPDRNRNGGNTEE